MRFQHTSTWKKNIHDTGSTDLRSNVCTQLARVFVAMQTSAPISQRFNIPASSAKDALRLEHNLLNRLAHDCRTNAHEGEPGGYEVAGGSIMAEVSCIAFSSSSALVHG